MAEYRILEIDSQRNGIGGEGFYTVRFEIDEHPRPLIAVIPMKFRPYPDDPEWEDISDKGWSETYVLDPSDLSLSWRGDRIYDGLLRDGLWQSVKSWDDARWEEILSGSAAG